MNKEVRDDFFEALEQMIEDLENDEYSEYLIWNVAQESNRKTAISALKELRSQFIDVDVQIFLNGQQVIEPKFSEDN